MDGNNFTILCDEIVSPLSMVQYGGSPGYFYVYPSGSLCPEADVTLFGLIKNGIETTIHYTPINDFTFYKKKMKLKNLDEISKRLISLPLYPKLKKTEIDYIISKIASFLKK